MGHGRRTKEEYEVNNNEAKKERNERICIVLGCGGNAQGESSCWSRAWIGLDRS